jgi:hypothetical protein
MHGSENVKFKMETDYPEHIYWESNSSLTISDIPKLSWSSKFCSVHNNIFLDSIVRHINYSMPT